MSFLQKIRCLRCFAFITLICGLSSLPVSAQTAVAVDMDSIKKELLADPLFLSHLHDKLSIDSLNGDVIRKYLLNNPQILLELQDILSANGAEQGRNSTEQAQILKENEQLLYHTPNDIILGNKDADITLLEFFDYNCSYCKHDFPLEKKLVSDNKNIRIIMKDYPILGDDSVQAHFIAQAVKAQSSDKYPLFHEKMMTMQGRATLASALAVAESLGIDKKILEKESGKRETQNAMLQSAQIGYRLGFNYAPVFVLGDKVLGAVNIQNLSNFIAEEQKRLTSGK